MITKKVKYEVTYYYAKEVHPVCTLKTRRQMEAFKSTVAWENAVYDMLNRKFGRLCAHLPQHYNLNIHKVVEFI